MAQLPRLPGTSRSRVFKQKKVGFRGGEECRQQLAPWGGASVTWPLFWVCPWTVRWLSEHIAGFPPVWSEVSLGFSLRSQCQAKDCHLSSRRSPFPHPIQAAPPWAGRAWAALPTKAGGWQLPRPSLCERLRTGSSCRVPLLKFSPWNTANAKKE